MNTKNILENLRILFSRTKKSLNSNIFHFPEKAYESGKQKIAPEHWKMETLFFQTTYEIFLRRHLSSKIFYFNISQMWKLEIDP